VDQHSAFIDSLPDDHACKVLFPYALRFTAPIMPEQGPDVVSGVVTMDDATFTNLLSVSRFNCRALPWYRVTSIVHPPRTFGKMVATGATNASYVQSATPK